LRCPVTTAVLRGLGARVRQFVERLCDFHAAASVGAEAPLSNETAIFAGVRNGPWTKELDG